MYDNNLFDESKFDSQVKSAFAKMEKQLEQLKAEKHPWYDSKYCLYQCMRVNELLISEQDLWKIKYQKRLQNEWWTLWEYFAKTRLADVYLRATQTQVEISEDLLAFFGEMKCELYLELSTMVEDEIMDSRDSHPRYISALDFIDQYMWDDPEKDEYLVSTKWWVYTDLILQKYFPKKSGRQSLRSFVRHLFEQRSIYLAIETSRIQGIKNLKTREEKMRFGQLINLYLEFTSDEIYYNTPRVDTREILEYHLQLIRMDLMWASKTQAYNILLTGLAETTSQYINPYLKKEHEWIYELSLTCLTSTTCASNTIVPNAYLQQEMKLHWNTEFKKIAREVRYIFVQNAPPIEEKWFYGEYPQRYTMDEYRIRDQMSIALEEEEFAKAKKLIKKLKRHSWFFRYAYHARSIQYNILINKAVEAYEDWTHQKAKKYLEKIKELVHIWRADVVRTYPHDQVEEVLIGMESADFMIAKLNALISWKHFDEDSYIEKMMKSQIERSMKKSVPIKSSKILWRNEPCVCGSGKKFKKCCWNKLGD